MALTHQPTRGSLAALIAEAHRRARRRRLRTAVVGGLTLALALAVMALGSGRGQTPQPPKRTPPGPGGGAAAQAGSSAAVQAAVSASLPANLRVGVRARHNGLMTVIQQPDGGVAPTWGHRPELPGKPSGLFQLDAAGRPHPLWLCPAGCGDIYAFAWSPDGTRVAIAAASDGNLSTPPYSGLHVIALATGADRMLASRAARVGKPWWLAPLDDNGLPLHPRSEVFTGLAWSPDSRWIAYTNHTARITVVAANGTRRHVIDTHAGHVSSPSWSPSGRWIAFSGRDGAWRVSSRPPYLQHHLSYGRGAPSWSPTRKRIALPITCGFMLVTPDGRAVARHQHCPRSNSDGRSSHPTAPLRWWPQLTWSPDGKHLAIAQTTLGISGDGVWVVNANGRGLRQVSRGPGTITDGYGVGWEPVPPEPHARP